MFLISNIHVQKILFNSCECAKGKGIFRAYNFERCEHSYVNQEEYCAVSHNVLGLSVLFFHFCYGSLSFFRH